MIARDRSVTSLLKRFVLMYFAGPVMAFHVPQRSGHIKHLSTGMSGVLVTTNDWEELCTSEASDLFNEVSLA